MSSQTLTPDTPKHEVFNKYKAELKLHHLEIDIIDDKRPWGGFIQLKESQAQPFLDIYFSGTEYESMPIQGPLTPKLLIIEAKARESWQYHHRREEIWRVLHGPVGVMLSKTDNFGDINIFTTASTIKVDKEQRHRLIGLDNWGVVAEIWKHTDDQLLSNEDDIIRIQDDYGR